MKILAAIMDVVHVRLFGKKGRYSYPSKVKRCLVYDPRIVKVAECDYEKEKDDG